MVQRCSALTRRTPPRANVLIGVLARRGDDHAIRLLAHLTHHAPRTYQKNNARWRLERIARSRDMGVSNLIEDATPTLGFDHTRQHVLALDEGAKAHLMLNDHGVVELHINNTVLASLETLDQRSDLKLSKEATALITSVAEQAPAIIELQRERLNEAMTCARTWSPALWHTRFVEHPLRLVASLGLVWTTNSWQSPPEDVAPYTFCLQPDGSLCDVAGQPFVIDKGAEVRLIHAVELKMSTRDAWRHRLDALGIPLSPIAQLDRPTYAPSLPEHDLSVVLADVVDFESGRALRRALYRMGFEPIAIEGLVHEGYLRVTEDVSVTLIHDAYSLSFLDMHEYLSLKAMHFSLPSGESVPPGLVSEMICLLRAHLQFETPL